MFRHIIWDFDGTIMDTYPCIIEGFLTALKQEHVACSSEKIAQALRKSVKDTYEQIAQEFSISEQFYPNYLVACANLEPLHATLFAGIYDLCQSLCQRGVKQYIFTHRDHASTMHLLHLHGMDHMFQEIISSDSGFARKPAPDAIYYLIHKYHMNPEEVLMIGDRELDLCAGYRAGVHTGFYGDPNNLTEITPNFIWNCWSQAKNNLMP